MTKHNRTVDISAVPEAEPEADRVEAGVHIRVLSELADELQRCGMSKSAANVRNAAKYIRKLVRT